MMLEDLFNAPNAKQIRDKVYRDSKKDQNSLKLNNIADEVLENNINVPKWGK